MAWYIPGLKRKRKKTPNQEYYTLQSYSLKVLSSITSIEWRPKTIWLSQLMQRKHLIRFNIRSNTELSRINHKSGHKTVIRGLESHKSKRSGVAPTIFSDHSRIILDIHSKSKSRRSGKSTTNSWTIIVSNKSQENYKASWEKLKYNPELTRCTQ